MRGHCFSGCEARGGLALLAEAAQAGTLPAEISEVLSRKDPQSAFMDMFQLCHLCRPCAKVSSVSSLVSSAGDALDSDLWEVHCCCRRTCCCKHREEMAGHQEGAEALRHPEKNAGTGFSRVAKFKSCFSRGTWHERLVEANVVLQGLVAGPCTDTETHAHNWSTIVTIASTAFSIGLRLQRWRAAKHFGQTTRTC